MLTVQEVQALIKSKSKTDIDEVVAYEDRLRLHSVSDDSYLHRESRYNSKNVSAFRRWLQMAHDILPSDKYTTFKTLLTFPLYTVDLVEIAYNELSKIFTGQDASEMIIAEDEEIKQDFNDYRVKINEPEFWKTQYYKAYQCRPSSYIVVDVPSEQTTEFPEPYFFIVETNNIIACKEDDNCINKYLIYKEDTYMKQDKKVTNYYQVDEMYYRHFEEYDNKVVLVNEVQHDLNFSPAHCISTAKKDDKGYKKSNIITNSLGKLDWLLFQSNIERHLELYAGFPIISVFEEHCDFRTQNGLMCSNGTLQVEDYTIYSNYPEQTEYKNNDKCPQCSGRSLTGAGTTLQVPIPKNLNSVNLFPAIQMTQGDTASIDIMSKKMQEMREQFFFSSIGMKADLLNRQSVNKDQISSSFESRRAVIMQVKSNVERVNSWLLTTVGLLRYGKDKFTKAYKNYGTKFQLLTYSEMQQHYLNAKESGIPAYELEQMRDDIMYNKYRNNPSILRRAKILNKIEPYRDLTFDQIFEQYQFLDSDKVLLKYNFNDLIDRFEIDNGKIENFKTDEKIELVIKYISDYMYEQVKIIKSINNSQKQNLNNDEV